MPSDPKEAVGAGPAAELCFPSKSSGAHCLKSVPGCSQTSSRRGQLHSSSCKVNFQDMGEQRGATAQEWLHKWPQLLFHAAAVSEHRALPALPACSSLPPMPEALATSPQHPSGPRKQRPHRQKQTPHPNREAWKKHICKDPRTLVCSSLRPRCSFPLSK